MTDTHPLAGLRRRFKTRSSVIAAWLISIVVVWPILSIAVWVACVFSVMFVLETLYPELATPGSGLGDFVGLALAGPIFLASAIVAALACYKTCRYLTAR